jgi:ribosomal subunit interface protein
MEIHFKSDHTKEVEQEVTRKVIAVAERKLAGLKKYLGKNEAPTQVYVELGRATASHQTGPVWRAQINLDSKGKRYHADAVEERIDKAVDKAVRELEAELRKAKKLNETILRKGGGAIKTFMRGFKAR